MCFYVNISVEMIIFIIIVIVRLVIMVMLVIRKSMNVFFLFMLWIILNDVYLNVVIIIMNIMLIRVVRGIILISGVVNRIKFNNIIVVVILDKWLWLLELMLIIFCLIIV